MHQQPASGKYLPKTGHQYLIITGNYWAFTLTDGALRMLVLLHFHQLGYSPLDIALLFLFYEFFSVVTNLVGGWLGARLGLNRTMNLGLALQIVALLMLAASSSAQLSVPWVMAAQALSGIAKDLNKMSAKSAVKLLVPDDQQHKLYRWVAVLTGSKNALKGAGFFVGGALLTAVGFRNALLGMATVLGLVWIVSVFLLRRELGKSSTRPAFRHLFAKSRAINVLSAARMFLFGSRDIWFVVALPVFLSESLGWDFWKVGGFLALWIIGYGAVQTCAPLLTRRRGKIPCGRTVANWNAVLSLIPALIAGSLTIGWPAAPVLIIGLLAFGVLFAINSSLHSYLIVNYADADRVAMDVGFYYMANAMGRLAGTVLSGWIFQTAGLEGCLWASSGFLLVSTLLSIWLPASSNHSQVPG